MDEEEIMYNRRPTIEEMRRVRIPENKMEEKIKDLERKMDRIIRMLTKIGYLIEDLGKVKK
jgi:hypothetical protein